MADGRDRLPQADWKEGFKKKQAGVSDMTLLSTISNEAINENLKKRFENKEIYVSGSPGCHQEHSQFLPARRRRARPRSVALRSGRGGEGEEGR